MTDHTQDARRSGSAEKVPERLAVEFDRSAPSLAKCPPATGPEVAFAGRSNAGKSSVLNRLTGNRHTAKVSRTPGRTQLLNFFAVRGRGYVVDLPGYGYAKANRQAQANWQAEVNNYLSKRDALVAVVLIMDIRHPNQPYDRELIEWAEASEMPLLILLNKADKLKYGARQRVLKMVRASVAGMPNIQVQCFSALTGIGLAEAIETIHGWLQQDYDHGDDLEPVADTGEAEA